MGFYKVTEMENVLESVLEKPIFRFRKKAT